MRTSYPYKRSIKALLTHLCALLLFPTMMAAAQSDGSQYENYVGDYEITPTFIVSIRVEDGRLYAQANGQRKFALTPTATHAFDYEGSDQSIEFVVDSTGAVNEIRQRADRFTRVAKRVDLSGANLHEQFFQAVTSGDIEKVKTLAAQGADVQALDTSAGIGGPNGRRPLNLAARDNNLAMIEALLELGADINGQNLSGFTALHHAIEYSSLDTIRLLVERGADLSIENRNNMTPAEYAAASGNRAASEARQAAIAAKE